jgi:hypothetical protein
MIGAELGREDYSLIPLQLRSGGDCNHLMPELTPEQIKLVVKAKKKIDKI